MSSFTTPSGERFAIFGEGGGKELADELDVPLLGRVPLTMPLREQADSGVPLVIEDPDDPASQAIRQVARGMIAMAPLQLPVLPVIEVGASMPAQARQPQTRGHVAADGLSAQAAEPTAPCPERRRSRRPAFGPHGLRGRARWAHCRPSSA